MKRPWYLTGWLILIFLIQIFGLLGLVFGGSLITEQYPNAPAWVLPLYTIAILVDLVAIVMLWMWKIMGFYITVGTTAVGVVLALLYLTDIVSAVLSIVTLVVLYLAMRPVWSNFR